MEKDDELDVRADATPDTDLEEDEQIQDWSQAAQLSLRTSTLPKSGEKDYEPDGTNTQELLLYRARKSMFDTLLHSARGCVVKNQVKAYYDPQFHNAVIFQPRGNFLNTMGNMHKDGTVWLEFHEFLYLAERGTVTPFYMMNGVDWRNNELPMSIEDLYMLFKSRQEMDKFFVFAHLKRLGFIVISASASSDSFYAPTKRSDNTSSLEVCNIIHHWRRSLHNVIFYNPWNFWFNKYTSTPHIYQGLNQLVPFHKAPKTEPQLRSERLSLKEQIGFPISLNVWKPRTDFKKKSPGLPDYQVVVYNKNDSQQHFPNHTDLQQIFKSLDYKFNFLSKIDDWDWDEHSYHDGKLRSEMHANAKPNDFLKNVRKGKQRKMKSEKKQKPRSPRTLQKRRLKDGYRSFLLAVMDDGLINFIKISEADFGSEDVWYIPNLNSYKHQV